MKFRLNINISDEIYYDFNKFWLLHSSNSAKTRTLARITAILLYIIFGWLYYKAEGFSVNTGVFIGCLVVFMTLVQIFMKKILWLNLKLRLNTKKKKGELKYTKSSVYEFCDDVFYETTDVEKCEIKYNAIECVRIIKGNMVLLQRGEFSAYIVPISSFISNEQYDAFIDFIKTKCPKIDFYEKI